MPDAKNAMIEIVSKTLKMDDAPSLDDLGEGMVQIKGKNHSFAIGNLMTGKLRQLVNVEGVLIVDDSEIDIDAIKRNCHHYDGSYSVKWIGCGDFKKGVCAFVLLSSKLPNASVYVNLATEIFIPIINMSFLLVD